MSRTHKSTTFLYKRNGKKAKAEHMKKVTRKIKAHYRTFRGYRLA